MGNLSMTRNDSRRVVPASSGSSCSEVCCGSIAEHISFNTCSRSAGDFSSKETYRHDGGSTRRMQDARRHFRTSCFGGTLKTLLRGSVGCVSTFVSVCTRTGRVRAFLLAVGTWIGARVVQDFTCINALRQESYRVRTRYKVSI